MKKHLSYPALFLLIFFLADCRKEKKDTSSPSISINSPATNQAFSMFDTIPVSGHVRDDKQLVSVLIELVDDNNATLQHTYPINIPSKDFNFNTGYILTEFHLTSGYYYLSITASDGYNTTQRKVRIYVAESPTTRSGYFINGASQPKKIFKYDTSMAQITSISLNTAFTGMAYGPYYRMLYINGAVNQAFIGYDEVMNSPSFTIPYSGGIAPTFTYVCTDGKKAYIGYYTGEISSVTYTGGGSTAYITGSTTLYPYYFTVTSKYGVGLYKDHFGGGDKIYTFQRGSGVMQNFSFCNFSVDRVFERSPDEFYVTGNSALGQAVVYLYSALNNSFVGPFTLPTGKLLSSQQVDNDFLLLALDNGNIYGYRHSNGTTLPLAGIRAQKINYNPKLQEVAAASNTQLYTYSLSSNYNLVQASVKTLPDSIIAFEVITNK